MLKPEALADLVVGLVKNALAPFAERVASVETRVQVLGDVRDRVVCLETKEAMPRASVADIREPAPLDLSPMLTRIGVLEGVLRPDEFAEIRERIAVLEVKAAAPPPAPVVPEPVDLGPLLEQIEALDRSVEAMRIKSADVIPPVPDMTTAAALVDMTRELVAIRERLAVVESRAPIPGPQGPAGRDGKDGIGIAGKDGADGIIGKDGAPGRDGKDGSDGVTLDDLSVEQQGERTMVVKATVGAKVKEIGSVTFPVVLYRGVWIEGKGYEPGDTVTWAGAMWHANKQSYEKPGEGSKAWRLMVKRGSDGRNGLDAPGALPVVRAR